MMTRALLLLLVLPLLAPVDVASRAFAWKQKRVTVYDYTGPEWSPYVREAVDRFNAQLPKHAPELIYVSMSVPCEKRIRAISVCVKPDLPDGLGGLTLMPAGYRNGLKLAHIQLWESVPPNLPMVCHEMFHAMGVVVHREWVTVSPCPYDDGIMRKKYKREKRR